MKKRFLLAVLPALLVLSACQAGPKSKNNNIFLEDTLAHDEIFGAEKLEDRALMPRKLGDDPVVHPDNDPSIGIQSKVENGKISFRFVAAVTFSESNITPTNAVWTRTVSSPDGLTFPKDTGTVACTTAYTKLSNGGSAYLISDYNQAQDPDTSYTHFVVYTLRNIPLETYSDYYVCAYLTLSGEGGVNLRTKAVAISVDQSKKYTHDPILGVSFITGTFSGNPDVINATSIRTSEEDQNKASFEGLTISKDDTFVINEFYNTKLYVKNVSNFTGENNGSSNYFTNDNNKMKATYAGKFDLFLNKSDQIYTSASKVVTNGYLYVDVNVSWWGDASAWTAVYAYKGNKEDNTGKWYSLASQNWGNQFRTHTDDAFFTSEMYAAGFTDVAVCRLKTGVNLPNDKTQWDSSITHNVYSVSLKTNGLEDCVYLYNNVEISMGSRSN